MAHARNHRGARDAGGQNNIRLRLVTGAIQNFRLHQHAELVFNPLQVINPDTRQGAIAGIEHQGNLVVADAHAKTFLLFQPLQVFQAQHRVWRCQWRICPNRPVDKQDKQTDQQARTVLHGASSESFTGVLRPRRRARGWLWS